MWTGHICRQKVQRFKKRGNDLVNVMFLEIGYFFCMHSKGILEVKKKIMKMYPYQSLFLYFWQDLPGSA